MARSHWTKILASEKIKRSSNSVSIINDCAYIYGGELRPREPASTEVFSVALDGRTKDTELITAEAVVVPTNGLSPDPRVGQACTVLSQSLYVFSGRGGVDMTPIEEFGAFWVFDARTSIWTLEKPGDINAEYPKGRSYHAMTNDGNNTIYLHAGCPESGRLQDLWSFNVQSKAWNRLADAPGPARGGPSIAYHDGKIFRMNGFDGKTEQGGALDVYETSTNSWSTITFPADGISGPSARSVGCLLALEILGKPQLVTLFGESDPSNLGHQGAGKMLSDGWVFDINSSSWSKLETDSSLLPCPRGWFDADVLQHPSSPKIILQGGLSETNERLGDLWVLEFKG